MITKAQAKVMYDYYDKYITKLLDAQIALVDGGVKSYTIDDRTLTRFDLDVLTDLLDKAIKKRAEYDAILHGRGVRKSVGVVPRDL